MNTSIMFLGTATAFLLGVVVSLAGGTLLLWGTWKLVQIALNLLKLLRASMFVFKLRANGVTDDIITDKFLRWQQYLYRVPSERGEE